MIPSFDFLIQNAWLSEWATVGLAISVASERAKRAPSRFLEAFGRCGSTWMKLHPGRGPGRGWFSLSMI